MIKDMDKTGLILLLPITIILFIVIWRFQLERSEKISYIGDLPRVHSALSIDDRIYINSVGVYEWDGRTLSILEPDQNVIYGVDRGQLIICKWKNHPIKEPHHTATEIQIEDPRGELMYRVDLQETLRITNCQDGLIYLRDNFPNSPDRVYTLLLGDDRGITIPGEKRVDPITKERIKSLLGREIGIDVVDGSFDLYEIGSGRMLIHDDGGGLWIYGSN